MNILCSISSNYSFICKDAQKLWTDQKFSTDALAGYGSSGKFDPTKDRAVLRLQQWKTADSGDYATRQKVRKNVFVVHNE